MTAGRSCTRRPALRDGWARVTRLGCALAALVAAGIPGAAAAVSHTIALFPSASSPHWAGFARVINHSGASGTVRITGIDDAGRVHGPVELALAAWAAAHFNSGDLEAGHAAKGLSGGLGDGEGDWRLRLESALDIEVLSYVRTGDGFVTAMHEAVPVQGRRRHVRFFNPASNASQVSRLRLVNASRALTRLMGADKNYLARLSDYPDVVAVIRRMAGSLAGAEGAPLARAGFTAADVALLARAQRSAGDAPAVLPDGVVKEDFYCTPLTRWPCSPWDEHEPWRWFAYAQQRGFRVALDASQSEGEGLRYEWQVAGRRIGSGAAHRHGTGAGA